MDADLALQIAVGVVALDEHSGAADAGFLVAQLIDHFKLKAVALGPARVHAQQHLRPVARLGAAGSRAYLDEGIAGVLGAGEHGAQVEIVEFLLEGVQLFLQFAFETFVLGAKFAEGVQVLRTGDQRIEGVDDPVERLELLNDLLGLLGVIPEVRRPHLFGQFLALGFFIDQVKASPGAGSDGSIRHPCGDAGRCSW